MLCLKLFIISFCCLCYTVYRETQEGRSPSWTQARRKYRCYWRRRFKRYVDCCTLKLYLMANTVLYGWMPYTRQAHNALRQCSIWLPPNRRAVHRTYWWVPRSPQHNLYVIQRHHEDLDTRRHFSPFSCWTWIRFPNKSRKIREHLTTWARRNIHYEFPPRVRSNSLSNLKRCLGSSGAIKMMHTGCDDKGHT